MSTHAMTIIKDGDVNSKEICRIYTHYDGNPECWGRVLAEFLSGFIVENGIPLPTPSKFANGMSDLTAQIIRHFKMPSPGNVYVYPAGAEIDYHYRYVIYLDSTLQLIMDVYGWENNLVWSGRPENYTCKEQQ